jgi:transposase
LKDRGKQRTDSTHVLAAVRALKRLERVGETLRYALNCLATVAPDWLREQCQPEWLERYGCRLDDERLPQAEAERETLAKTIGIVGFQLLDEVDAPSAPVWLREIQAVQILRQVGVQQYYRDETGIRWRKADEIPPSAQFIGSP